MRSAVLLCTALFGVGSSLPALAGNEVLVGEQVPKAQRIPMEKVSHEIWDGLLKEFVDDQGMVDYRRWSRDAKSKSQLDDYLGILSSAELSKSDRSESDPNKSDLQSHRLAYWINAYNAVTVKGILREYPTSSIRNHTARLWGYNIWKDLKLQVAGSKISLEAIEHEVLRELDEPRIHFAIVCASMSCPKLLNEAYVPARLNEQLNRNARDFFSDKGKFRFDSRAKRIELSQIMNWFAEDFGESKSEQLAYYAKFAPAAARELLVSGDAQVSYLKYDWGLNEQR